MILDGSCLKPHEDICRVFQKFVRDVKPPHRPRKGWVGGQAKFACRTVAGLMPRNGQGFFFRAKNATSFERLEERGWVDGFAQQIRGKCKYD